MKEWKEYKATDFCTNVTDGTHDSPKPKAEGHYLITSKHLQNNVIDFSSAYRISEEDYMKVIQRSRVEQFDILFSMIGTIGNTVRVVSPEVDFAVKNMAIFKMGQNDLKSKWLYYWLKSSTAKAYISSRLAGSTQSYLTLDALRNFPIYAPDERAMQGITDILSSIDDKIELNNRINHNLEEQAQALYKSWFVDFEPFKDEKFVESELGMIPSGWRVGTLSEIADVTMGQSPSGSTFNEDGRGIVFYQGRTEFGFRFPSIKLYTTAPTRFAEPHSVLMSVRAPVGDINVALDRCCIGRGLAAITAKDEAFSFVLYALKGKSSELDLYNGEGTVFGSINRKDLEGLSVLIPPMSIVKRFNDCIRPIDDSIEVTCKEIVYLSFSRDSLLPRLMSGQLSFDEFDC